MSEVVCTWIQDSRCEAGSGRDVRGYRHPAPAFWPRCPCICCFSPSRTCWKAPPESLFGHLGDLGSDNWDSLGGKSGKPRLGRYRLVYAIADGWPCCPNSNLPKPPVLFGHLGQLRLASRSQRSDIWVSSAPQARTSGTGKARTSRPDSPARFGHLGRILPQSSDISVSLSPLCSDISASWEALNAVLDAKWALRLMMIIIF